MWFDETGLPWVNPSPNIRSLTQALLYSGVGLLEATNLSVGRGTETPFEVVGAPWITDPSGSGRRAQRARHARRHLPAGQLPPDVERLLRADAGRRAPRRHRSRALCAR